MIFKAILVGIGVVISGLNRFIPVKRGVWIFGSGNGDAYIDNSKYFYEYVHNNHKNIEAIWITRSSAVKEELQASNYQVCHNLSLKGLWYSLTAEVVVFSTSRNDLLFTFKKRGRKFINLWHGMPMKKIAYDFAPHRPENKKWNDKIWDEFVAGIRHKEAFLIPSTSEFFNRILSSAFRNRNVVALGQPRTDVFFTWKTNSLRAKLGFTSSEKIITYMPTHRAYGRGKPNPKIFMDNEDAITFLCQNNCRLVWKFHRNMIKHSRPATKLDSVFVDLTLQNVDPQELIFITDILITDYSSCYIDYLLLNRPVIFYHYDDYRVMDNELYYDPNDHDIGPVATNEIELLDYLKKADKYACKSDVRYHLYKDGNSCHRIYQYIEGKLQ